MSELTQSVARRIIDRVGGSGQPPEYGIEYFSAGLDPYLDVIDAEYLSTLIPQGGSTFKMVVGVYGGGKTHFLYAVRDRAWKHNFVTANVSLSPNATPFSKLELVYRDIAKSIVSPLNPEEILSGYERGIESVITRWFYQRGEHYRQHQRGDETWQASLLNEVDTIRGIESTSFLRAFRAAIRALSDARDQDFASIGQWLKGEGYSPEHKKLGILQKIDKTTAFEMIRSLSQLIRWLGYSGLVIAFDEAEQHGSMSTKESVTLFSNLRQVIDECARSTFQGVMVFYAVPDAAFLERKSQDYEALKQRLEPVLDDFNPTGVRIVLERVVPDKLPFLTEVGNKLAHVYEMAYGYKFEKSEELDLIVQLVADLAIKRRFADESYKRVFVQRLIRAFNYYRRKQALPSEADLE
jgi:hypothetical protein